MKTLYCLLALLSLSGSSLQAQPDTLCTQKFVLFDKTEGDYCLWFYRAEWEGPGRCGRDTLYTLFLLPDRVHGYADQWGRGNWVPRLYEHMKIEEYELLKDSAGIFSLNDTAYFTAPEPDTSFTRKYAALPRQNDRTWYWECADGCTDLPVFVGVNADVMYSHPAGLYKNYRISEARYYRQSGFLILLTEHPQRDCDGKTMNGLIVVTFNDGRI